jgi:hypothetical protein
MRMAAICETAGQQLPTSPREKLIRSGAAKNPRSSLPVPVLPEGRDTRRLSPFPAHMVRRFDRRRRFSPQI